jgi:hypothetical protein
MAKIQDKTLQSLFEIRNPEEVMTYLSQYPELEPVLIESYTQILKYFGNDAQASLKLEPDMEEDFATLCVDISSSLNPSDASDKRDLLVEEWFVYAMRRLNGNLLFDVEF